MARHPQPLSLAATCLALLLLLACGPQKKERHGRIVKLEMDSTRHGSTPDKSYLPPSDAVQSIRTMKFPGTFKTIFCDSNDVHLAAATINGFSPINSLYGAYHLSRPIVKVETCDAYKVDTLTHSMPFLVPKAQKLLEEIGYAFSDTIKARSRGNYRIIVTSLTRSDYSSARLQKRNRNASDNSCHRYGTTFDISWTHFDNRDPGFVLSEESLKNVLGEIIYNLHRQERCYVMYERKQSCFHITVR